jgi:hypothetical protein
MNKLIKPAVSTSDIFWFSIRDIKSNPIFFLLCLFPIYLLIATANTFNDIIIVYNDYQNWEKFYSNKDFSIGLAYIFIESYVLAAIALIIHNKVIKKKLVFNFFSKELFIYLFFYLISTHSTFLLETIMMVLAEKIPILGIVLFFSVTIIVLLFLLTFWFWILYLPNMAVRDKYSFMHIFKNSKVARLTLFFQIFYYLIFLIPGLVIYFLFNEHFATIIVIPTMILFGIVMLSNTYLEWLLLEKNRK